MSVLEKRIESLEIKVESLLDFVLVLTESQPPIANGKAKSEAEQSDSGTLESEPFLFDKVTLSSPYAGVVDFMGEVLNRSGISYSILSFQVTFYNSDDGVTGNQNIFIQGLKDGQTKSFNVPVTGVYLDEIRGWKIRLDTSFEELKF